MNLSAKKVLLSFALTIFACGNAGSSWATDTPAVFQGVLTEYCHKVRAKVISNCLSQFTWDKDIVVEAAVDATGKIVDTHLFPSTLKDRDLAVQAIKSIQAFDAPPASAKLPLWLSIATTKKADDVSVNLKDIDYGPYMADLQKRIKRAWFPPKGSETVRVTVQFKLFSGGTIGPVKVVRSGNLPLVDAAALQAVKNAEPFQHLPDGSPDCVEIQFTFDYNVFDKGHLVTGSNKPATAPASNGATPASSSSASSSSSTASSTASSIPAPAPGAVSAEAASGSSICLKQGLRALDDKDYPMAIQFLESAVALDPQNDTAKKSLSISYTTYGSQLLKSNPDQAMTNFHKAKKYWPENPMTPDTLEQAAKLFSKSAGDESSAQSGGTKSGAEH
jgi:TonB family protein